MHTKLSFHFDESGANWHFLRDLIDSGPMTTSIRGGVVEVDFKFANDRSETDETPSSATTESDSCGSTRDLICRLSAGVLPFDLTELFDTYESERIDAQFLPDSTFPSNTLAVIDGESSRACIQRGCARIGASRRVFDSDDSAIACTTPSAFFKIPEKDWVDVGKLPLTYLLNSNSALGFALRNLLWPFKLHGSFPMISPSKDGLYGLTDLHVVSVTTDRYACVRELLKSIRLQLGQAPTITVAVQTKSTRKWKRLGRRYQANMLHLPWDTGLAASRNEAVRASTLPIVLLTDDDFQLDERSQVARVLQLFRRTGGPSIIGGNLLDVEHWSDPRESEISQSFAMFGTRENTHLQWTRVEDLPRNLQWIEPGAYLERCDIVDNFALIKRADVFDRGIFWNPRLKIGAEHQDFYVRLMSTDAQIFRTNLLKVRNVRVQDSRFKKMRSRTDTFFRFFFEDLYLTSFEITGERRRVLLPNGDQLVSESASQWKERWILE